MNSPRSRVGPLLTTLALTLSAAGCGGSSDDFGGASNPPEGFKSERLSGVSFAHPGSWAANTRPVGKRGGMVLKATAPEKVGSVLPTAALTRASAFADTDSFDSALDFRRDFAAQSGEDRSKSKQEDVDVPGAKRAILFTGKVTYGGERYDSYDLAVLLEDRTAAFFLVEVPEGTDGKVILDSFRVDAG